MLKLEDTQCNLSIAKCNIDGENDVSILGDSDFAMHVEHNENDYDLMT